MKKRYILAIETSCDETSVALVENGETILANVVYSQIASHQRFGGVVPEVASRHHVETILTVVDEALKEGGIDLASVDAIAVTEGPGLVGALLIGISVAKTLSLVLNKPLIAINHVLGHIYASQLVKPIRYPALALVASGGHTELIQLVGEGEAYIIGETLDDACGEAYDKVARLLGIPYPGGKKLDELAQIGHVSYHFPRPLLQEDHLNFSFSGLKSAVMNHLHNAKQRGESVQKEDVAASFQAAVLDLLVTKTLRALAAYPSTQQVILAGGVAANSGLRAELANQLDQQFPKVDLIIPPLALCGDNAAMIGAAADIKLRQADFADLSLNASPSLSLPASWIVKDQEATHDHK